MKEILISSSVLILIIVILRHLLRNKVSRRLQYGLWLLVALRLLIPFQFGQSDYSVTAMTEKLETDSKPIQQFQDSLQQPVVGPSRDELYDQYLQEYLQQIQTPPVKDPEVPPDVVPDDKPEAKPQIKPAPSPVITPEVQTQLEEKVEEQITAPTLSEVLTVIWIGGMVVMGIWFLATNLIFLTRAKKDSTPWDGKAPVRVRISPNVPTPCLVGLFRPTIYLTPQSIQDEQSLNHILTHEISHLRHGDHIWSLVRCICLCIYWFNPLVWLAAILSKRDCELACDEAALRKLGDAERIPYGKTLLATVTRYRSPAHILETATAMNETKKQLKERVNCIVKKPRNILTAAIIFVLIAALTAGCTFIGSKPEETKKPADTESTEPPVTDPSGDENKSYRVTLHSPEPTLNVVNPTYQPGEEVTIQLDRTEGQRYTLHTDDAELSLPHYDPEYVYYTFVMPARDVTVDIEIVGYDTASLPPPTRPAGDSTEPPSVESSEDALAVATALIDRYKNYDFFQLCCNYEGVYADMSEYMTENQMDVDGGDYHGFQYKITCCHTPEEVRNHIRWTMDDALIDEGWADEMLFTDGENLYLPVLATGGFGYSNIRVGHWSSETIVAYADVSSEYEYDCSIAFHILLEDGHWCIKDTFVYAIASNNPPNWITP